MVHMDCGAAIDLVVGEMGVTDDELEMRMEQYCCRKPVLESGPEYLLLAENHAPSVHY
jgi:hypothetical protein